SIVASAALGGSPPLLDIGIRQEEDIRQYHNLSTFKLVARGPASLASYRRTVAIHD
ncbi:hypothetical protein FRC01_004827, partial [Tulasnella sp. 417]